MSKQQIQGNLARLLATENLTVEHRKIPTAYFDIDKRILALPIWKEMSDSVYTMLVGHEVGHALYTPKEDWIEDTFECPKSFINIIEDARIEKLMKRRYPGLKSHFFNGYKELNDKNFFEISLEDLPNTVLIDRINLHFKIGSSLSVPFSSDELIWVERTESVETWEEVVALATDLYKYLSEKQEKTPAPVDGDQSDVPSNGEKTEVKQEQSSQEQTDGSSTDCDSPGQQSGNGIPDADLDTPSYEKDEFSSVTDEALTRNQKRLVDEYSKENIYVDLPLLNLDKVIIPHDQITEDLNQWSLDWGEYQKELSTVWDNRFNEYKQESKQEVNYMVKEFEMKKSADMYRRSATSRTGVLDTQKLHTYKFNDDIFKKVTTCSEGKNHGLIFYLDWSGSMNNLMEKTIRQLYSLIWFCQKVQVPFRVYAFTNAYSDVMYQGTEDNEIYSKIKTNDLYFCSTFRLMEILSSKMSARNLNEQMKLIYRQTCAFKSHSSPCIKLQLGGTPLIEAAGSVPQVLEKFKKEEKVQKTNVIFLTDGEGHGMQTARVTKEYGITSTSCWYRDENFILRDRKKCKSELIDVINRDRSNIQVVSFINKIVDANIVCFRIIEKRSLNSYLKSITDWQINTDEVDSIWRKESAYTLKGYGFTEFYLISEGKMEETSEFSLSTEQKIPTKREILSKFKKHMGKRRTNKMILSNFVSQIA
jgi:hypothetical protein